jgi:hypothetical protein
MENFFFNVYLPYGIWTMADGTQIMFNRQLTPIWSKQPSQYRCTIDPLDAKIDKSLIKETYYLYSNLTSPQVDAGVLEKCIETLDEWRVRGYFSKAMHMHIEAYMINYQNLEDSFKDFFKTTE